jgi:hypothetical protein
MKTPSTLRSFRKLSHGFLHGEEKQHFTKELLLFAILFIVSAWPVLQVADAIQAALK